MCQKWFQKHETTSLGFKKFEKNKILNFCHFWVPYATFEQQRCRKKRKMQKFLQKNEIEKSIFGRKQTNFGRYVVGRSGLSKILPKIFFIQNGQKFMILSQKNIPPPKKKKKKKSAFLGGGGSGDRVPFLMKCLGLPMQKIDSHLKDICTYLKQKK